MGSAPAAATAQFVGGFVAGSRVEGQHATHPADAALATRYYQRPDAQSFDLDPNATSPTGVASAVQVRGALGSLFESPASKVLVFKWSFWLDP